MTSKILIVEDEANVAAAIAELCRRIGYKTVVAATASQGARALRDADPQLAIVDIGLPDKSGIELLAVIREHDADLPVLIVTAHGSLQNAVEAKKRGATGYMVKPLDLEQLAIKVRSLLDARRADVPTEVVGGSDGGIAPVLVGSAPSIQPAFAAIAHACASDVPVLITGPTGIGKSLAARIVHEHSSRAEAPFVTLSCASLPQSLLEAEVFGHEKGAFTGADGERSGYVERAAGGTLFLDEIADVPVALQVKLLRVVEEKTFVRVGGQEERKVDLRIIAATNHDLDAAVAAGRFREDLLYRLRVLEVLLPPLADRRSDLPALCAFVLAQAAADRAVHLSDQAMRLLVAYEWPGNVRELRNVIERAVAVCSGPVILPEHLPEQLRRQSGNLPSGEEERLDGALHEWLERRLAGNVDYTTLHDELEGRLLSQLLPRYEGKPTLLARELGMNRATLRKKLRAQTSPPPVDDADGDD